MKVSNATGSGLSSVSLARPTASLASTDSLPSRTTGTPSNRPDSGTRTSMVSASTGLNRACSVASDSLSVRPTRSEVALKVSCTVPASKSTTRAPSAPLKFPVPFQTTLISILLPLSDRLLEPVVSRCTARGTTMTSSETTAGPTVTSRLAPTVVTVRVTL